MLGARPLHQLVVQLSAYQRLAFSVVPGFRFAFGSGSLLVFVKTLLKNTPNCTALVLCFCFSNTAADVLCTYVPELTSSNSSKKQIFQNFLALTTALQNADKKVALSTRRKIFATTNTR